MYCLRCRAPKTPAGGIADYRPASAKRGALIGICPDCDGLMYRACSPAKLDAAARGLTVSIPKAQSRLTETPQPVLDEHSQKAC